MKQKHFPACYVELPFDSLSPPAGGICRRAPFYLSAEEWIARHLPPDNYLFSWQLGRTVVMGRNQVAHQEVDLDFCRRHGIDVVRRRSGGGAIFADEGNIMFSLITPQGPVEPIFQAYAESVAAGLRQLGADAEVQGRNDIVLRGQGKVCGNAFYHLSDRNIVHGTMLYDTDPDLMQGALHARAEKLAGKGVRSVRARVGVLKGRLTAPEGETDAERVAWLRMRLRRILTDRTIRLDAVAVAEIEALEQAYYAESFLYGSAAADEVEHSARFEGCGSLTICFALKGSLVRDVRLTGDFFELADAHAAFRQAFCGIRFTPESLCEAARTHRPETSIRNLSAEQLQTLLRP